MISPGATVLDVGANSGLFALLAASVDPTVTVHPVEPVPRVFSVLEANVALNVLDNVACVTVDELLDGTRVDVVKIDAEGSEDAVLRGASETLRTHRPHVLAEVLGRSQLGASVTVALAGHDYRFFRLGPEGVRPCTEIAGGTDDDENHNYLFVHAGRVDQLRL